MSAHRRPRLRRYEASMSLRSAIAHRLAKLSDDDLAHLWQTAQLRLVKNLVAVEVGQRLYRREAFTLTAPGNPITRQDMDVAKQQIAHEKRVLKLGAEHA